MLLLALLGLLPAALDETAFSELAQQVRAMQDELHSMRQELRDCKVTTAHRRSLAAQPSPPTPAIHDTTLWLASTTPQLLLGTDRGAIVRRELDGSLMLESTTVRVKTSIGSFDIGDGLEDVRRLMLQHAPLVWTTPPGVLAYFRGGASVRLRLDAVASVSPPSVIYTELGDGLRAANLTLDPASGAIEGTLPEESTLTGVAEFPFVISAQDVLRRVVTRNFSVARACCFQSAAELEALVASPPVWVTAPDLGAFTHEQPLTPQVRLNATTANHAHAHALLYQDRSDGTLAAAGLTLDNRSGHLRGALARIGTPTHNVSFRVAAVDALGRALERTFFLIVRQNSPPRFALPEGLLSIGTLYATGRADVSSLLSVTATDEDTTDVLRHEITGGALAPGLTLQPDGAIVGTALSVTADTTFDFFVSVSDGTASIGRNFSLTVLTYRYASFGSAGTHTWSSPVSATLQVLLVGGGGGGRSSGGGGGGAVLHHTSFRVSRGVNYTLSIGSAGSGGSNGQASTLSACDGCSDSLMAAGGGGVGSGSGANSGGSPVGSCCACSGTPSFSKTSSRCTGSCTVYDGNGGGCAHSNHYRWSGGGGGGAGGAGRSAAQCCGQGRHDVADGGSGAYVAAFAGVTTTDGVTLDGYFGGGAKGSQQCTCVGNSPPNYCGSFWTTSCQSHGSGQSFGGGQATGFFVVRY